MQSSEQPAWEWHWCPKPLDGDRLPKHKIGRLPASYLNIAPAERASHRRLWGGALGKAQPWHHQLHQHHHRGGLCLSGDPICLSRGCAVGEPGPGAVRRATGGLLGPGRGRLRGGGCPAWVAPGGRKCSVPGGGVVTQPATLARAPVFREARRWALLGECGKVRQRSRRWERLCYRCNKEYLQVRCV